MLSGHAGVAQLPFPEKGQRAWHNGKPLLRAENPKRFGSGCWAASGCRLGPGASKRAGGGSRRRRRWSSSSPSRRVTGCIGSRSRTCSSRTSARSPHPTTCTASSTPPARCSKPPRRTRPSAIRRCREIRSPCARTGCSGPTSKPSRRPPPPGAAGSPPRTGRRSSCTPATSCPRIATRSGHRRGGRRCGRPSSSYSSNRAVSTRSAANTRRPSQPCVGWWPRSRPRKKPMSA